MIPTKTTESEALRQILEDARQTARGSGKPVQIWRRACTHDWRSGDRDFLHAGYLNTGIVSVSTLYFVKPAEAPPPNDADLLCEVQP